jgi:hypothetical protein
MKPSEQIMLNAGVPLFNSKLDMKKADDVPVRKYLYALFAYLDEQDKVEVHCDCSICNP